MAGVKLDSTQTIEEAAVEWADSRNCHRQQRDHF
jgi:hypothetical protein